MSITIEKHCKTTRNSYRKLKPHKNPGNSYHYLLPGRYELLPYGYLYTKVVTSNRWEKFGRYCIHPSTHPSLIHIG